MFCEGVLGVAAREEGREEAALSPLRSEIEAPLQLALSGSCEPLPNLLEGRGRVISRIDKAEEGLREEEVTGRESADLTPPAMSKPEMPLSASSVLSAADLSAAAFSESSFSRCRTRCTSSLPLEGALPSVSTCFWAASRKGELGELTVSLARGVEGLELPLEISMRGESNVFLDSFFLASFSATLRRKVEAVEGKIFPERQDALGRGGGGADAPGMAI